MPFRVHAGEAFRCSIPLIRQTFFPLPAVSAATRPPLPTPRLHRTIITGAGTKSSSTTMATAAGSPAPASSTSPLPGSSSSPPPPPSATSTTGGQPPAPAAAAASTTPTQTPTPAAQTSSISSSSNTPATEAAEAAAAAAVAEAKKPIPALPAPDSVPSSGSGDDNETRIVQVNGNPIALDKLGPMVVGRDGTISRIANWPEMTDLERENTLRVLGKRNQLRLANLRAGRPADEQMTQE
ncbi:hypothetical protein MFIFM68171_03807 [Madurella fahalii]|uniref:Uncharacterized protein n=1 Tax=Madurella fahalii TaxID=1157608 RepID=A0ABQ0G759_9PEZI